MYRYNNWNKTLLLLFKQKNSICNKYRKYYWNRQAENEEKINNIMCKYQFVNIRACFFIIHTIKLQKPVANQIHSSWLDVYAMKMEFTVVEMFWIALKLLFLTKYGSLMRWKSKKRPKIEKSINKDRILRSGFDFYGMKGAK